jgi:hypothetical protein
LNLVRQPPAINNAAVKTTAATMLIIGKSISRYAHFRLSPFSTALRSEQESNILCDSKTRWNRSC